MSFPDFLPSLLLFFFPQLSLSMVFLTLDSLFPSFPLETVFLGWNVTGQG